MPIARAWRISARIEILLSLRFGSELNYELRCIFHFSIMQLWIIRIFSRWRPRARKLTYEDDLAEAAVMIATPAAIVPTNTPMLSQVHSDHVAGFDRRVVES